MRRIFASSVAVLGLLFAGMGVANAAPAAIATSPSPATSTTVVAADDNSDDSGDNGLWGLVGLLGLGGLLGLRRRNDAVRGTGTAPGAGIPPRA